MVRAIRAGRKSQTRRIVKHQDCVEFDEATGQALHVHNPKCEGLCDFDCIACPYGRPGDRLWVRETHWVGGSCYRYDFGESGEWEIRWSANGTVRFDEPPAPEKPGYQYVRWRKMPSIHMKRSHSRILLEVTDVRVERLHEIMFEEAIREGMFRGDRGEHNGRPAFENGGDEKCYADPIGAFRGLWEKINGVESWQANPWVWVVSFEFHKIKWSGRCRIG